MSGKGAKIHKEREKRVCIFDFLLAHVSVDEYRQLFRPSLALRIGEAIPALGEAERYRLSDQMTSKWLALCPLGIE